MLLLLNINNALYGYNYKFDNGYEIGLAGYNLSDYPLSFISSTQTNSIPLSNGQYQIQFIFRNQLSSSQSSASIHVEGKLLVERLGGYITDRLSPSFCVTKNVVVKDGTLNITYSSSLENVQLAMFLKSGDGDFSSTPSPSPSPEPEPEPAPSPSPSPAPSPSPGPEPEPSPSPVPSPAGTWYINFNQSTEDEALNGWNNFSQDPTAGKSIAPAAEGKAISLILDTDWDGANNKGFDNDKDGATFPAPVSRSYFYTSGKESITISGLTKGAKYDFTIFASSWFSADRTTIYRANGKQATLNAALNQNGTATLDGLLPNENNEIVLEVEKAPQAAYGFIGALVIHLAAPPVPNQIPQLSLAVGQKSYLLGEKIALSASAKDTDGQVKQVAFYSNGNKLAEVDPKGKSTVEYLWTAPASGQYSFQAKATDNEGAQGLSEKIMVSVTKPAPSPEPSPSPVPSPAGTWYINFNQSAEDEALNGWNNFSQEPKAGKTIAPAADGQAISLKLDTDWDGANNKGFANDKDGATFPAPVSRSYFYTSGKESITIGGLSKGAKYDFTIFASSWFSADRTTIYRANGKQASLNAALNQDGTATLAGLSPNENNEIILEVEKAPQAAYGFIGALVIHLAEEGFTETKTVASENVRVLSTPIVKETSRPLAVYPNPISSAFNVKVPSNADVERVDIHNLTGILVYSQKLVEVNNILNIDISNHNIPGGRYILTVVMKDGSVKRSTILKK